MTDLAPGSEALRLAREIRILDDAETAAREELDDLARRFVSLRGRSVPATLSAAMTTTSAELTRVVVDRDALVRRLSALSSDVPDRVH